MFSHPRRTISQLTLILALGLAGCSSILGPANTPTPAEPSATPVPPTPTLPPLAVMVNDEYITQAEFEAELDRYRSAQQALEREVEEAEAEAIVLDDLIAQLLLSQGARQAGFELSEADLQARLDDLAAAVGGQSALDEWIAAHGYTGDSFQAAVKRSAEAAWMRDKIVADVPLVAEQVHIQQILSYNQDDALQALAQLNAGADFDELAGSQFYDPTTRGELGWVPRGYLLDLALEEAAFSLAVGTYSDVIETPAGFHIIKVLEREAEHALSPDALLTLQELALRTWLEQKRAESRIDLGP